MSKVRFTWLLFSLLVLLVSVWLRAAAPMPATVRSPLSPEEAQKLFRLPPGLHIELVACEPDLQSPVAMAFDEAGRLWVVEMLDYPNGPGKGKPPEGRIVILEDRDGTGRYRRTSVFADRLLFANGLALWQGGAVVTCAPHILYLSDPKRTGKAQDREILYEGFATENPQLRVSHPILGLDGWIYVSNGLRGGMVRKAGQPAVKPINLSGMDFRFDLISGRHQAIEGMGQFGNTFDDWGQRFVCTNRNHLVPFVLPGRYVARNPFLAPLAPRTDNQSAGGSARVYPLSRNWTTASSHGGTFTAACGVMIYRGDMLPAEFRNCAFTCEPTGNLIRQEILTPDGAGYRHKMAREGVEFLASPDDWFRPVSLAHGPDGALYIVDMYRAVIEHPQYMPAELKERPDLHDGKERGRIWRIVSDKTERKRVLPHLHKASPSQLVAHLGHANAWWRVTAQRLLLERQDRKAIGPLRKLLRTATRPQEKVHAAWLLNSFAALDDESVLHLLADRHPRVSENAVRLAESRLGKSDVVQKAVLALAEADDARVRFQVALSLGEWDDDRIVAPLVQIALRGANDPWTRLAIASAVPRRAGRLLGQLCKHRAIREESPTMERLTLVEELAALVGGRREAAEVASVLQTLAELPARGRLRWQMAGLQGMAQGMGRRGTQLSAFLETLPSTHKAAAHQATTLLDQAARLASDEKADTDERLAAVGLLAHASWTMAKPALEKLLEQPEQSIRLSAVRALSAHSRPEVSAILLRDWRSQTPAVRRELTEALLRQPERISALLDAIAAGTVKPGDLDPLRARQMVQHPRADLRKRALTLLRDSLPADRKKVLAEYQEALKNKGDRKKGKIVFEKNCSTCHRVAGVGVQVGPDISDTLSKTPAALLTDILDPNAAIDNNYVSYTITTTSGKVLTGLIAAESATSVTLKRAEGQTDTVLRQDIEQMASSGVSLMPEGVEKTISIKEMADLLSFLKEWRYLDGMPFGKR
jgi:putative membrane-bound dehydrogenase-like protein